MALVLSSISGSIQSNSKVGLTGSIIIANRPDNLFPSIPSDATLFVSGSSSSDYAVFGGSVVGSGSLLLKNASGVTQFNAASTGLTVSDSSGDSKFSVAAASGNTSVGGTLTSTGVITANGGISGSHTKLADGSSYIVAGSNIVVTTGSNGSITIAGTMNASTLVAGSDTQVQFNDGGSSFGASANYTFNKTTNLLKVNNISGSITSSNVTAGQVVLAGTGGVLSGSNGLFWNNASGSLGIGTTQPTGKFEVAGSSGSLFAVTDSMSGSLLSVNNVSGLPILEVFSDNRLIAGGYNTNAFVISGSRVAVGTAPISTTELVVSGSSTSSDKVLLVKAGVAGQTGALVDVQNSAGSSVFLVSNTGISGSLTKLTDGSSYLIAGNNVTVTTGSNGAVTIAASMNASSLVAGVDTQVQFNDGGSSFGGDSGLTYNKTTDTLNGVTGSFFSLSTSGNSSVGGALTVTGASTLNGNVTVGDAAADTVTVNGTTTFAGSGVTTTFAGDVAVNGGDVTSSATTFNLLNATVTTLNIGGAATAVEIGAATGTTSVNNDLTVDGNTTLGNATTDTVTLTARVASNVLPSADVTYNLGSSSLRWANIYTGDLHLKNERGDYTLIEEEDFLTIRFNKTGKRYKFMLEPVPELDEALGNFSSGPKG